MNAVLSPGDTTRHMVDRRPRGHLGFSWARFTLGRDDKVTYRLFRRDHERKTWVEARTFHITDTRSDIAREVWRMRIRLREAVDAFFFASEGVN